MRAVAAIPAAGLLAGAAFGLACPDLPRPILFAVLSAGIVASIAAWRRARSTALAASVAASFAAGGALLSMDAWERAWRPPLRVAFEAGARAERARASAEGRRLPEDDEAFAIVEGILRADASPGQTGVSLSIDVDEFGRQQTDTPSATSGGVTLTVLGSLSAARLGDWRAGRRVRVPAQLHRPSRYLDPGIPDHERDLARRGTTLVGTVKSGALIDVLANGSRVDETMSAARAFSRRAIASAVGRWSAQSAAIVTAIVIGDRAGLDPEVQRRLQEAGTYHVIAISGGNIAILAGLLLGVFRFAGWLGRAAMLGAIALLVAYARLVGGGASVDRATLMAVVYFGARAFDQRSAPLNALAVVAGLLIATDPLSVADPALLLTFGATLAILVVVPAVITVNAEAAKDATNMRSSAGSAVSASIVVTRPLVAMFAASVAAEAMLFPVGAAVFSRVTFAGLVLNFFAIPLMAVAQLAGMCVVPLAAASTTIAAAAGWVAHVGAAGLVWSARLVRFAPALTYRVAPPPAPAVIIYYGALATAWVTWPRRTVARVSAAIAAAAALWILVDPRVLLAARGDGRLHVTFIDAGQGDATLVRFPRGSTLLVDAGGLSASGFDVGDRVIAPVLRNAALRRLDYLALTHGDPDHIGGAASILSEFKPREVWEGIPVPRDEPLTRLRLETQALGRKWANVYVGGRVVVDDVEISVRNPPVADWERQKVRNDDSMALDVRWRDVSILLTGDIGRAAERDVAAVTPPARLRIVKVPHHGSLTSSGAEFVGAMRPAIAVVSVGRSNHFGHPVPEVLERYRTAGAEIFRTDQDGAITVDTDGKAIAVHTFTGKRFSIP